MAKGYWIVRADVHDPEGYKEYQALNAAPFKEYGAKFLVRGGKSESVIGEARQRAVVIEFPSYQAALDCYNSEGYQKALELRKKYSSSDQVIVEGYDAPQSA